MLGLRVRTLAPAPRPRGERQHPHGARDLCNRASCPCIERKARRTLRLLQSLSCACMFLGRVQAGNLLADGARSEPGRGGVDVFHQTRAPEHAISQHVHDFGIDLACAEQLHELRARSIAHVSASQERRGCRQRKGDPSARQAALVRARHLCRSLRQRKGRRAVGIAAGGG